MIGPALERLDALLRREAEGLRASAPASDPELAGWYLTHERVDALLARDGDRRAESPPRAQADAALAADPAWARLSEALGLGSFERDAVLLALAPELDLRYELVLGYLNDDLTRRWATRGLALRLLGDEPEHAAALDEGAPLVAEGVLRLLPGPGEGWRGCGLALSATAARHLLGLPPGDAMLARRAGVAAPGLESALEERVRRLAELQRAEPGIVLVLEDAHPHDAGAVVDALAGELGVAALELLDPGADAARQAALAQRLAGAVVHLRAGGDDAAALARLGRSPGVTVISAAGTYEPPAEARAVHLRLGPAPVEERRARWRERLAGARLDVDDAGIDRLADRFALSPAQIDRAARAAADDAALAGPDGRAEALALDAARRLTRAPLLALAVQLPTDRGWDDLVLPRRVARRLREVAGAMRGARLVFDTWGFGSRTASRRAVNVLFSGPSGTGKTLAARVIAADLGVDIFAIDLSAVVSKWIGETEKNLDRIFTAARGSNALLLFDEADALFGKRSEVRDAHDRYANVEVAYLLQKLEQHDGGVILATNLSGNLDAAFSRRMHFVVEFPLPGEPQREQLWRDIFPTEAPLGDDVDLEFLAHRFPISGGEIRSIALDAAFAAAGDGRVIGMSQLVRALERQLAKRGRTTSPLELQQYHGLLERDP